jgi:nicotinamidase-related amidase
VAELTLEKSSTALLMVDFHTFGIGTNPVAQERKTVEKSRTVLDAARRAGVQVVYVVLNFRQGYPEISDHNKSFGPRKTSGQVLPLDSASLIVPAVAPEPGEPVVVKHRVNAFGTDLERILKSQGIDTLVLMGHATSGVILSTVRYASDADYQLILVEDCCADFEPDIHSFLMERIFPPQATVVRSQEVVAALSKG